MNFQQLKIIREAARQDYNLTEVANMLFTSQSGVSRHIRELEDELGIEIFVRRGKRLLGMTEPGKALLVIAERILNEASNVRRLADLFTNDTSGVLTIATTHTQARYSLPEVIKAFRELFPEVRLELIQGTPQEIATLLQNGEADIGIASERLSNDPQLVAFPWFRWHHSLLVPLDHPLTQITPLTLESIAKWPLITYRQGITGRSRIDDAFARKGLSNDPQLVAFPWFRWHHSLLVPLDHPLTQITPLTLESIAKWPLITYRQGITGRSRIDDAFARKGLPADIVLSAQDSDVIKTYVALGLGIGLVAEQSSGEQEEKNLIRLDTRHLFDANTVWLGLKRGQLQRNYVWRFLELCNAGLSVEDIKRQVMENSEEEIDYQI
ncbi:LysR substrate-binding domain-containing protein [Escherichia coli]